MNMTVFYGILIPFSGTVLGSACVFFMKNKLNEKLQKALTGMAAGVMVAASIWSLLVPSMEQSTHMGKWSFVPAAVGFWVGILFLLGLDRLIPHIHLNSNNSEGVQSRLKKTVMMLLAVALHNIPEGMTIGVVLAAFITGKADITAAGALALSIGMAIQNFPEGAVISMPLKAEGMKKSKAFVGGVLSGVVEPIGAIITVLAANVVVPILPYLLSFAAGAMIYVVVEELIPEKGIILKNYAHFTRIGGGFRYVPAVEKNTSRIRGKKPYQYAEKRGFSAAGGTENRKKFSVLNGKADIIQRQLTFIMLCKPVYL